MPKLIIKQHTAKHINNILLLWLLAAGLILLSALAWWWLKPNALPVETLLKGANSEVQTHYQVAQRELNQLIQIADNQAKLANASSPKAYHEQAITHIDTILEQLNQLDEIVEQASLTPEILKNLMDNHQYQRDYWDAQRHFQTLRLAHFEDQAVLATQGGSVLPEVLNDASSANADIKAETLAPTAKTFQFAVPPADASLPADFCVLGSGTCKAP